MGAEADWAGDVGAGWEGAGGGGEDDAGAVGAHDRVKGDGGDCREEGKVSEGKRKEKKEERRRLMIHDT